LRIGDLWGGGVMVTTSRGAGNTLAMAEYAVAAILHFAKGLHRAAVDREAGAFAHRAYRPLLLEGKTACVVGVGGIGHDVGRLRATLGMRVLGIRRHPQPSLPLPPGFSELGSPGDLDRFLPDSDFVVICCQWTPETTRLFDIDRFTAMKAGSVLVNVARGEIIDEEALVDALRRDHLRGVALDVYVGEFEHTPMARLWSDPRVLITPHISGATDQDRGTSPWTCCRPMCGTPTCSGITPVPVCCVHTSYRSQAWLDQPIRQAQSPGELRTIPIRPDQKIGRWTAKARIETSARPLFGPIKFWSRVMGSRFNAGIEVCSTSAAPAR
jgi:hypothetical protein